MEGAGSAASLPADYQAKSEFVLGRLMYPSGGGGGRGGRGGGNWQQGGTNWTVDYPRGDRTFAGAIRRLTRIDVRSVEQPVNPDEGDDIFFWPYLHVGMPTNWNLSDAQAAKIREYLLRGGFLHERRVLLFLCLILCLGGVYFRQCRRAPAAQTAVIIGHQNLSIR